MEDILCHVLFPQVAEEFFAHCERGSGSAEQAAAVITALVSRLMKASKVTPASDEKAALTPNTWAYTGKIEAMRGRWRI